MPMLFVQPSNGAPLNRERRYIGPKQNRRRIETYAASSGPLNRLPLTASVRMKRFGRGIAMAAAYGVRGDN